MDTEERALIRLPEVRRLVGLSRSEVYRRISAGEFPKPVSLGSRAIAFVRGEVLAFIAERIAARDAAHVTAEVARTVEQPATAAGHSPAPKADPRRGGVFRSGRSR